MIRRRQPVALPGWNLPPAATDPTARTTVLGPHGGAASVLVDRNGWVAPAGTGWSVDWRIRTGDGWEAAADHRKTTQRLIEGSALETSVPTAVGPVVQRVAVGIVGGLPAAIIEIENTASVAIAVAVGVRPFGAAASATDNPSAPQTGIAAIAAGIDGIEVDGLTILTSSRAAVSVAASTTSDVFEELDAHTEANPLRVDSTSGQANAALVWPLAHTGVLRVVVPLAEPVPIAAAVPGIADIVRGWDRHLENIARVVVQDSDVSEVLPAVARDLACRTPQDGDVAAWMIGLTELGLGREAAAGIEWLSAEDEPAWTIYALGRLHQLGFEGEWKEAALEPLARAAHLLVKPGARKHVPAGWRSSVVSAAERLARDVEQPDVADRLDEIAAATWAARNESADSAGAAQADIASRLRDATPTWTWPGDDGRSHSLRASAEVASGLRNALVMDDEAELLLLAHLPASWRGLGIEAHQVPTAHGEVSFGLRWHGPRPALLWEVHAHEDSIRAGLPITVRVPGVSSTWSSTDLVGETLLPDPGWG